MQSMSMSADKHAERHNIDAGYRAELENVDPAKIKDDEFIRTETIEQAYRRIFGAAAEAYNAKQVERGHPERQIPDYLAKVRASAKEDARKRESGEKWRKGRPDECVEYVGQIGSHDTWAEELTEEEAKAIYRDAFERIEERTRGAIDWFQVAIHVDEPKGAPHIHMAGIPIGTGYKRGMDVQVSMRKALATIGVKDLPELQDMFLDTLEEVAGEHGIERRVMGCEEKHRSGRNFQQAMEEQARINEKNERKRELGRELDEKNEQAETRLECLQGEIEQMEPSAQGIGESAGALIAHRGDGSRERALAAEGIGLESRIGELERQVRAAGERAAALEGEREELAGRVEYLRGGLARARERFEGLAAKVDGYIADVGQRVAALLQSLGVRAYAGNPPLSERAGAARAAARAYNADRSARGEVPQPSRRDRPSI